MPFGTTASQDIQASNPGQVDVQQDDAEIVPGHLVQRLRTIACNVNGETSIGQKFSQTDSCGIVVVNHQQIKMGHRRLLAGPLAGPQTCFQWPNG
jgi:hypothetical protein